MDAAEVTMVTVVFAVVVLVLALYWLHTVPTPQLLRVRRDPSLRQRAAAGRRAAEYDR
ncbi:MAG: hypothetical protein H0W51_05625 [Euzebyales bacterium]|nr:hypothetical protein [Euzebyales bacterium]MDQ3343155.1 hypothetical protein [Actinomycetota bacterium]